LFPDTLLIKLSEGGWGVWTFTGALSFYWWKAPAALLLTLAPAPAVLYLRPGPLSLRGPDGPRGALLLGLVSYTVIHLLAYSFLIRVPPYHWYYAMEVGTCVIVAAFVACDASRTYRVTNLLLLGALFVLSASFVIKKATVAKTAALHTNWGTPEQYRVIAGWINEHVPDERMGGYAELGTLQYYTKTDMINEFSNRGPVLMLLQRPHSPLVGALLRWNYRHYPTELLINFRYTLGPCDSRGVLLSRWTTETPVGGFHEYCVYQSVPATP
jgi:hypothetical protein